MDPNTTLDQITELTILAGEIMLRNGAETSRVEETMGYMARACGALKVESFVIPTGVFLTVTDPHGKSLTIMRRITDRTINLDRIAKVNELSRRLDDKRMDYQSVHAILVRISRERTGFSLTPTIAASGVLGGGFTILQNGGLPEALAAFVTAMTVRFIAHVISRLKGVRFTFEFLGGAAAALFGSVLQFIRPELNKDVIIIGGIIPLVPGMAVTNSIRDIIAGDLLSGLSRGLEAMLTSIAVAMGVVIVLAAFV